MARLSGEEVGKRCARSGHRWAVPHADYSKTTVTATRVCARKDCGAVRSWLGGSVEDDVPTATVSGFYTSDGLEGGEREPRGERVAARRIGSAWGEPISYEEYAQRAQALETG